MTSACTLAPGDGAAEDSGEEQTAVLPSCGRFHKAQGLPAALGVVASCPPNENVPCYTGAARSRLARWCGVAASRWSDNALLRYLDDIVVKGSR